MISQVSISKFAADRHERGEVTAQGGSSARSSFCDPAPGSASPRSFGLRLSIINLRDQRHSFGALRPRRPHSGANSWIWTSETTSVCWPMPATSRRAPAHHTGACSLVLSLLRDVTHNAQPVSMICAAASQGQTHELQLDSPRSAARQRPSPRWQPREG
jgi:hypothetical protein